MKIGCYQAKPHKTPIPYISFTRAERELIGNPARVDLKIEGDKIIIEPGKMRGFKAGVIQLSQKRVGAIFTNGKAKRACPIGFKVVEGRFIISLLDAVRILDESQEPSRERKVEPLYNPKDNSSGNGIHFKSPMSPKTVYRIAGEIDTYFSDGKYMRGYTDKSIAKELGVSQFAVETIRKDIFGEILPDPKQDRMEEIALTLKTLQLELLELRK